jgi:hypothetical protein
VERRQGNVVSDFTVGQDKIVLDLRICGQLSAGARPAANFCDIGQPTPMMAASTTQRRAPRVLLMLM